MSKPVVRYENGNLVAYSGTTNGDVLTWNSGSSEWESAALPAAPVVSFDYELFVAKNGNDGTGDGSLSSPYLTIGAALTAANAISGAQYVRINVAPGTYAENLSITRAKLVVAGAGATAEDHATTISGTVTVNPTLTTSGSANEVVELTGLLISAGSGATGPAVYVTGTQSFGVVVSDSYVTTEASGQTAVTVDGSAALDRVRFWTRNSIFTKQTASTAHVLLFSRGNIRLDSAQIYNNTATATSGSAIVVQNNANVLADRLLVETNTPSPAIDSSGTHTGAKLILSNSSVYTYYSAGTTAPAVKVENTTALTPAALLWQNIFTVSNSGTEVITGTLGASIVYYGALSFGPSAAGVVTSTIGSSVTLAALTETLGDVKLPSVATASYPLKVDANKKVVTGQINLATEVTGTLPAGNQAAQSMSGDVTGTTAASTVVALRGFSVANVTPNEGQVLTWNGDDWVPGASAGGGSGGGGVIYYFNATTAPDAPTTNIPTSTDTLVTVKEMGTTPEVALTTITSSTLSLVSYDIISGYVTDLNVPSATDIPAGLWEFNIWAAASGNIANQTLFRVGVYKYDGVNAPTLIANSDDIYVYDPTTPAQYIASVVIPAGTTLLTTDRIYVQFEGKATTNNRTITFYYGDAKPTHVHTTLPSITGTGLVKVINGVIQSPASSLINSDVSATAAIAVSKLDGTSTSGYYLTTDGTAQGASWAALPASGGTVTSVGLSGGTTGLSVSGTNPITTSGTFTLGGTLVVANGGTGQTSLAANSLLVGNGTSGVQVLGPTASSLAGWNGSSTASVISLGSGLSLSGTTLNVTGAPPTGAAGGILGYPSSTYPNPTGLRGVGGSSNIPLAPASGGTEVRFTVDSVNIAGAGTELNFLGSYNLGTGAGGAITITGGTSTSSIGGGARLFGGNSSGGSGGHAVVRGGTGTTANGSVYIGDLNTASVFIGGTTYPLTAVATGDVLYASGGGTLSRLAAGANGQVLTLAAGIPSWSTPAASGVTSITAGTGLTGGTITSTGTIAADFGTVSGTIAEGDDTRFNPAPASAGKIPYDNGTGYSAATAGTSSQVLFGGSAPSFGNIPYDIAGAVAGTPATSTECFFFVAVRACTIQATGHYARCQTAPSGGNALFTVYKQDTSGAQTSIGTFTINSGNKSASFSLTATSLAANESIVVKSDTNMYSIYDVFFTFVAVVG